MGLITFYLIFSILIESGISTLPLTLLVILFGAVVTRRNEIFLLAFLSGLFLDVLTMRIIGLSSLYFTVFICVVFLYQKKFEIETVHFISGFSFLGALGYLILTGAKSPLAQALFVTLIISISFFILKVFTKPLKRI